MEFVNRSLRIVVVLGLFGMTSFGGTEKGSGVFP